ncbi:WD repeat-containing protein 36 [Patella vulgata]|uniref:WD repeat-containing protein 36 n=1 Tax=Patella vulgata TaxID=6465 RepID=UPI00217FC8F5|nr:WD repeat-containing protein 36 [Patella vulgata]
MVTGSSAGHIALWNLEERKLQCQMRDCHTTAVTGMKCLQSEPLMVTSAADNTLKVWIFDMPDGSGRLLRLREGHSAPPNKVSHYDTNGHNILSAGQDSTLRSFSTLHDKHNKNLGRASFDKAASKHSGLKKDLHMMPPITQFTSECSRESDWDNIVSCHRGLSLTTTWNYNKSSMGKYKFNHERFETDPKYKNTTATAVNITSCGNFVLIGYSSGHVDKYNLQSGLHRGSYGKPTAHDCCIRGVVVDGLNQITITAGQDGTVKFWKFHKPELIESIQLASDISHVLLHRESSMAAVALDDFTVSIVDIDTRREVRRFEGHDNRITDMTFSPDARWLITAAMDATVRTWDLPTGKLVDCFLIDSAVTSLSMSPTGDFLVTTHVDNVGVYLWSNMTLYSFVSLRPLEQTYEPKIMVMPGTNIEKDVKEESSDDEEEEELNFYKTPEQISNELVTLSLLPNSRWQNLLSLDIIKARNKPKEPPKKGKAAPFFLNTIAGITPTFDLKKEEEDKKNESHVLEGRLLPLSDIGSGLLNCKTDSDYEKVMNKFKGLGPSAIDVEIRSLVPDGGGSVDVMVQFVKFINHSFTTNKNFEIAQAYLALFLQLHAEVIANERPVIDELEKLSLKQSEKWTELQNLFTQSLCLINYLRTATL